MGGLIRQPVKGFLGENRLLPDDLIADNVAVDGQNVDYSSGTIKKRQGHTKTHARSYKAGGVRIDNDPSNDKALIIRDQTYMDLAGAHTIEFTIKIMSDPAGWSATSYVFNKRSGTDGYLFAYIPGSFVWFWQRRDGGGTARTAQVAGNITASSHPTIGAVYHFAVWRDASNVMGGQITRQSDGVTSAFTTVTCTGDSLNTRDLYIGVAPGAAPAAQVSDFIIDEFRIWNDQRSLTEIDDCKFRELTDAEVLDSSLVGYWPLNDNLNIHQDRTPTKNNAVFYIGSPCYVPGLVPNTGQDNFALRGDGWDDYGTTGYDTDFATITNTGRQWTIEFWARLDVGTVPPAAGHVFLSLGNAGVVGAGQRGAVFIIFIDAAGLLTYLFSTTTTYQNTQRVLSTPYSPEPGVPFHIALVKVDAGATNAIYLYINGVEWDVNSGLNDEAGPSTGTTIGMEFLCYNSAGTRGGFGAVTIDDVRLWNIPRSGLLIQQYYNREYPNSEEPGLIGYWRFNAADKEKDETGNIANFTVGPTEDAPACTEGLSYPAHPQGMIKLIAPVAKPIRTDETNVGRPVFANELLIATKDSFWTQQGTNRKWIKDLNVPGSENLYAFARHAGFLVACNGVGRNYVYQGSKNPMSMTMPTPTNLPGPIASIGGAGTFPAIGRYYYGVTFYNTNLGLESALHSPSTAFDSITAITQNITVDLTPVTNITGYSEEITHIRIYRLDVGAIYYRLLTTVAYGTASYVDTGTSVTSNAQANLQRSHLDPMNICESHNNRLFMSRGSDLYFSEPDSCDFGPLSIIGVDSEDGDAITGLRSGFGVLVIFKKNSIHILDGEGPNTFSLRKVVDGVGCMGHHTIASGPGGMYFLGHDGAYVFDGGGGAKYISHSQQPVFSRISHAKAHLATGVYIPETHQYVVSFDAATEAAADPSAPSAEAYDSDEFRSLFTSYYRCTSGVDAVGAGATINDADVTSVTDLVRGGVLYEIDEWEAIVPSMSSVAADFTIGFWRKFTSVDGGALASYPFGSGALYFQVDTTNGPFTTSNTLMNIRLDSQIGTLLARVSITATEWHQVVVRKTGVVYTTFVDGVAVASVAAANPASATIAIGQPVVPFSGAALAYLDNIYWVRDLALTAEQIKGIYVWEAGGIDVTERLTYRFDEETQAWAKDDKQYDYLVLAEHSSRVSDCFAGMNGFVARVFNGATDLATSDGDTAYDYTKSGSLSAVTGNKITVSSATFPTQGDGYAGCEFVAEPTDTTLETQRRTIIKNTTTVLYLDAPLISSFTGAFYIAPIDTIWESRWIDGGDAFATKMYKYFNAWCDDNNAAFTIYYKTDRDETYTLLTFTASDDFTRFTLRMRGRKVKIKLRNIASNVRAEVKAFMLEFAPGASVP